MVETREAIEVLPSAARLVGSLRDVGYSFRGAVADLIDNSISANASRVSITMSWNGADSFIRITDNGHGMGPDRITEALRFGSDREYKRDDLGKFGLGLNTASLSQCKQFLVSSKSEVDGEGIHARGFDVDLINERDAWLIESIPEEELPLESLETLTGGSGTCVVWSKLDRILGDHFQDTAKAKDRFFDHAEDLERHLGMVFHKFLEGTAASRLGQTLEISINGRPIEPWNPFAPQEQATQQFSDDQFDVAASGTSGTVRVTAYVLPRKDEFSSDKEFERLSGPSKWNQQQGFYVYRSDRMIQSGGWSRLGAADEHTKQARVALEFFPELDPAFGINISKMSVALPGSLREILRPKVASLRGHAKRSYGQASAKKNGAKNNPGSESNGEVQRGKLDVAPPRQPNSSFGTVPTGTDESAGGAIIVPWPPAPIPPPQRIVHTRRTCLERAAESAGESAALRKIIDALISDNPGVAHELGW
ncbi:ATP-binding protein [Pseudarthrobacter sp. HLT3-5]|uniref:ATP-binding protein n=1 Tax=Pseudarthrobacter cellobiosi TaxID=2953654 RepID=UPI00208FB080|nr:ATP-binding protein [Pseudarthrobacter sp. HLT3-5]MCO4273838.1 ATP-binding protein [Pseudarthrobacter sp. HLT3-5]